MERSTDEIGRERRLQKVLDEVAEGLFASASESLDPRLGAFKVFVRPGEEDWTVVFFQGGTVLFGLSLDEASCDALDAAAVTALFEGRLDEIHETVAADRVKRIERDLLPLIEDELGRLLEGRVDGELLDGLSVEIEDLRGTPGFPPDGAPWPALAVVVTHLERDALMAHLPLDFFEPGQAVELEPLAETLAEALA